MLRFRFYHGRFREQTHLEMIFLLSSSPSVFVSYKQKHNKEEACFQSLQDLGVRNG